MNIGLLVFLVSVAGMIGLGVYAYIDSRRAAETRDRQAAEREAAYQARFPSSRSFNQWSYLASIIPTDAKEFERSEFVKTVERMLEITNLVAVPITDTWREQMKAEDLARFMHENAGCKLRMDGKNVVLYVPDEDTATMARLAL